MKTPSLFDSFNLSDFTEKRYLSAPVYFEPMRGSGELLTVAGIVQGNGELVVKSLISPKIAQNIFGKKGGNFIALINMVISQLKKDLDGEKTLDKFSFKMDSAKIGAVTEVYADDARHALKQVAMLHASLCDISTLHDLLENRKELFHRPIFEVLHDNEESISDYHTVGFELVTYSYIVARPIKRKIKTVDIQSCAVNHIEKLDPIHSFISNNKWMEINSSHKHDRYD